MIYAKILNTEINNVPSIFQTRVLLTSLFHCEVNVHDADDVMNMNKTDEGMFTHSTLVRYCTCHTGIFLSL